MPPRPRKTLAVCAEWEDVAPQLNRLGQPLQTGQHCPGGLPTQAQSLSCGHCSGRQNARPSRHVQSRQSTALVHDSPSSYDVALPSKHDTLDPAAPHRQPAHWRIQGQMPRNDLRSVVSTTASWALCGLLLQIYVAWCLQQHCELYAAYCYRST